VSRERTRVSRRLAPVGVAARRARPGEQVAEIQRARLLAGAVGAFDEHGYAHTTVGHIALRAGVSRRTFYELFADREACLAVLFEDVVGMIEGKLATAGLGGLPWRERVRGGLAVILGFFDREPVLARVCVIQVLRGGPGVLERRDQMLARLAAVLDEGRGEGARGAQCTTLTAEGLVGAAFGIVYARLLRGEHEPLMSLLPELMGMVVLPYLGPAAARREQSLKVPVSSQAGSSEGVRRMRGEGEPLRGVRMRLTYRTARVLEGVAERPGASNRILADGAGIHDPGQISKLLRRLEGAGLLVNTGKGYANGQPNAWRLTPRGEEVTQSIRTAHRRIETEAA
jgi:AcrR family transcriptional regulator